MKPTPDGLGVEIKLVHGENDLDVESGRRPSSGEASAVEDYMCCGREDDLDQGLDFTREEAASAVEDAVEDSGMGTILRGWRRGDGRKL